MEFVTNGVYKVFCCKVYISSLYDIYAWLLQLIKVFPLALSNISWPFQSDTV